MRATAIDGYTSPIGCHRHKCEACGFVWEHKTVLPAKCFNANHSCPRCGEADQTLKYRGPDAPSTPAEGPTRKPRG